MTFLNGFDIFSVFRVSHKRMAVNFFKWYLSGHLDAKYDHLC